MHKVKLGDKIKVLKTQAAAADVIKDDILLVEQLTVGSDIGEFIAGGWWFTNYEFDNGEIELALETRQERQAQVDSENKAIEELNDVSEMKEQIKAEAAKETKVKPTVNYHVLNDSIVLNYAGKTQNIASDDGRYKKVLECIQNKTLDLIPELVEVERAFQGTGLELRDGLLYDGETPFPSELNARILKFKDAGLPYDNLVAFWNNLKKNPSFNSRKMMFAFLEHNGHPLTQDGCFIAYRGVTEDFKDKHTKTFDNSPGSVCEMPRSEVDENPNNTCSSGLHVACFAYAKSWGEKLVTVKVNPADVVAVPTDYDGTKMRVCRFEVVEECAAMLETLVHDTPKEEVEAEEEQEEEYEEELEEGECGDCGHMNDEDAKYCSECGAALDND